MDCARGTGPGEITADGCAVEFYALLPSFGEADIVHSAVPEGASILELGCGTGRILRPLARLGHPVLGVDESAAMLARIPDLPTVRSRIETLRLGRTFGAVLLASNMINVSPELRQAFLASSRSHLGSGGVAVFQQAPPAFFAGLAEVPRVRDDPGGIRRIIRSARWEPPCLHMEIEYQAGGRVWTHAWACSQVGEEELGRDLAAAGLRFGSWLTGDHGWFTAHPAA